MQQAGPLIYILFYKLSLQKWKITEKFNCNGFFYLLQERMDLGEILLSLNYLPSAGRLNVDIIKAKQLLQTDMIGGSGG